MDIKVGQRYHYIDASRNGVLEIVAKDGCSGSWYKIKFIQYFGPSPYELNSVHTFTIHDGNWEYLIGQDRPI